METVPLGSRQPGMGARCYQAQRRIGPSLGGNAVDLAHEVHSHTQCIDAGTQECWQPNMGQLGGLDGAEVGVRLAQLRGEQASNTNQGDLVMDIGLTERALCSGLNQLLRSHTSHTFNYVLLFSSCCNLKKESFF